VDPSGIRYTIVVDFNPSGIWYGHEMGSLVKGLRHDMTHVSVVHGCHGMVWRRRASLVINDIHYEQLKGSTYRHIENCFY
jgi:hypothetical protein